MSFNNHIFTKAKDELTKVQRTTMKLKWTEVKPKKIKEKKTKLKWYCPKKDEGYYGSINHTCCHLCYNPVTGKEYHKPIRFDKNLGHNW